MNINRIIKGGLAGASLLTLSSCFIAPGHFTSQLTLLSDGSYSYSYDGEIQILTLAMMMDQMGKEQAFEPYCEEEVQAEDGDFSYEERECTEDEVIEQRADYEAEQAEKISESAEMRAAMGGLDPSDEDTIDAFAERLERQAGWDSVEHKGNALFEVRYRSTGQLPPNFGFPIITDFPSGQPFMTIARWDDGKVKVSAPLMVASLNDSLGLLGSAAMSGAMGGGKQGGMSENGKPPMPQAEGSFVIRTDGEILTNNTETGPISENGLKVLAWQVGKPGRPAPEALIGF